MTDRASRASRAQVTDVRERPLERPRERSIILRPHEVRGILAGRQTQLRRVVVPQPVYRNDVVDPTGITTNGWWWTRKDGTGIHSQPTEEAAMSLLEQSPYFCPFGRPGERLWVRETWASEYGEKDETGRDPDAIWYRADGEARFYDHWTGKFTGDRWQPGPEEAEIQVRSTGPCRWSSPLSMPRWASRLTLEIVAGRVQRLQSISEEDTKAEGCTGFGCYRPPGYTSLVTDDGELPEEEFQRVWDKTNKKHPWETNPFVRCLSVRKLDAEAPVPCPPS